MKPSEIVKPTNLDNFIRLQISCLTEDLGKIQFLARFDHQQTHFPNQPVAELMALYEISQTPAIEISLLVTDKIEQALDLFDKAFAGKQIATELGVAWINLNKGLLLDAVRIPKPWGQEIWYTGIEQRGVSKIKSDEGVSPLDWVIAAAPEHILGLQNANQGKTPILLKILDPLPDEVYGDLYFEMHEEKQEVYIVTHVDKKSWPDGNGGIRFGFNQTLRKTFSSDQEFKRAYLCAVQDYQKIRQQVDSLLDKNRLAEKMGLNDPVIPEKIQQWQQALPKNLIETEKQLRNKMENFIAIKSLILGDVIKVPCFTPHSLQHGVRTVEFQTPVYERKILSFAQKVLTQSHWDTEAAIDQLLLDAPEDAPLKVIEENQQFCREQVVQFSNFRVERITLSKDACFFLKNPLSEKKYYRLILVVSGEVAVENNVVRPEDAQLLPAECEFEIRCLSEQAVLLLAESL